MRAVLFIAIGGMSAAGHRPRLVEGNQRNGGGYLMGGFSLTVGFSASR